MVNRVDLDEVLYQSVVGDEFRTELLADPNWFGFSDPGFVFPPAVEPQDRALLDLASGSQFSAQCASTCSAGPFTIVCDAYTK
jgi:Family of unknown function (DUF5973)